MASHRFDPPRYEWKADNAREAENLLNAAIGMIDAYIATLAPEGGPATFDAQRTTPVSVTISLDLSGATARVNDQRVPEGIEEELTMLSATDLGLDGDAS